MDCVRPSFRGDLRAGPAGGAGPRGTIWLFAGHPLDSDRRDAGRGGAGFRGAVLLNAPQWEVTGANGEGGTQYDSGCNRSDRHSCDYDHFAGGTGASCSARAGRKSVGRLYCWRDDTDRDVYGRIPALLARGQSHGGLGDWRGLFAAGSLGRKAGP